MGNEIWVPTQLCSGTLTSHWRLLQAPVTSVRCSYWTSIR